MERDAILRGAAVFGSCYIKRWLEPRYDQLIEQPFMAKLRAASLGTKSAIEAILYALTAFAENKMSDRSPLGLMLKTLLMDAAPEISARMLKDARADLTVTADAAQQPHQSIASKMLALDDAELLSLLLSIEDMDATTKAKFLTFAAKASDPELRRFASLTPQQRSILLGMHGDRQSEGSAAASFKSFMKDFWAVVKVGGQKAAEVSLPLLSRYLVVLLHVLKTSATLLAMAFIVCTASTLCGRWSLFALLIGLLGASAGLAYLGRSTQKRWLSFAGMASGAVMAMLAMIVAAGYPDAAFAVAVFLLIGLPTLAIIAVLIPATTVGEILRRMFPEGHRTLVRSFQMLLAAFFGVLFFSMILLLFPPQNPVAFLFIVPAVLLVVFAVGFGLSRISPEAFLRTPVILGIGAIMLVTMGVMSMPNLRHSMRKLPETFDLTLVDAPTPVTFGSSKDIDFVSTKDGEVKIWYAERAGGGYDLFRCEGVGPYYAKDGRRLTKADNDTIRLKIAASVNREAAEKADALRRAEQEEIARKAEEQKRADREAADKADASRRAEQEQAEQNRLANERKVEEQKRADQRLAEQRKAAQVLADKDRRAGYVLARSLPGKVDFVVCAATAARVPMGTFAAAMVRHLKGRGKSASSSVFSPAFVTSGAFDLFFGGRGGADLQDMPVSNMGNRLLLARVNVNSVKPGTSATGLYSASIVVAFSILSANDGSVVEAFELNAVGPGTSDADATAAALDRILEQLGQHGF
jgi:hypothetical protein